MEEIAYKHLKKITGRYFWLGIGLGFAAGVIVAYLVNK